MSENHQPKVESKLTADIRSWWQKINQHLVTILVIATFLVVVIALIILGYRLDWTGFNGNNKSGKTLWDWMQLLLVPFILAIGGFWLNQIQKNREEKATKNREVIDRNIAFDNQQAAAIQAYINNMSELLLEKELHKSKPEDDVRKIARAQILTVLTMLGIRRKRSVLQFLYESGLISRDDPIIDLDEADIRDAILRDIILKKANLKGVYLYGADLREADLQEVDLRGANLSGADLSRANLKGAEVSQDQLERTKSLKGATMPDNSKHL